MAPRPGFTQSVTGGLDPAIHRSSAPTVLVEAWTAGSRTKGDGTLFDVSKKGFRLLLSLEKRAAMSVAGPYFTCPHCGETHEGLPTDHGHTLPDDVWAIPEPERPSKARWTSDVSQSGERHFIRCLLSLPFTDQDGAFGWGLWVEVARPVFRRYLELYDVDASQEPPHPATIANQPPPYEPVVGAAVTIQFGPSNLRPTIRFPASSNCRLAVEQRQGIDSARYHEILRAVGSIQA